MIVPLLTCTALALAVALPKGGAEPTAAIAPAPESAPTEAANGSAVRTLFALSADVLHLGDGRTVANGIVLVENGRIRAVGADVQVPQGVASQHLAGHLAPGFVLAHSNLLPGPERFDPTRAFFPEAASVHGFRSAATGLAEALGVGVTTVVVGPDERNVVGGLTAVVKTHGQRVVEPRAHLMASMSSAAVDDRRHPTSFSGLVIELRRLFQSGEGAYGQVTRGTLPLILAARDRNQVVRAVELGRELGLRGNLLGATLAGEQLDVLAGSGWTVIFDTPAGAAPQRVLDAMAAYAKGDAPFAFAYSDRDALRMTVAQLLRRGVPMERMWSALTAQGASAAAVGNRVGKLERGFDADLVLWNGHPLELTSTVQAVYVNGERAHSAAAAPR